MLRIVLLDKGLIDKWDTYVTCSPSGTFYHLSAWIDIIRETFGFESFCLMALNEKEEVKGVLPLFLMRNILGKAYLISNPSSNYAGVCSADEQTRAELFEKAKQIAVSNHVQYMEIRQLRRAFYALPTKEDFVTMFLDMKCDEQTLWEECLTSKARNQTRKAYKSGLKVDIGKGYLDDFYRVISSNFRDLGTPVYPKKLFANILKRFSDSANLFAVIYRGTVIGGMLFIGHRKIFSDPWASSLREFNNLCPNNILYWEAIKYARSHGYECFDFGRSTINSGTFRFKQQWGAQQVPLYYQYLFNNSKTMPSANTDDSKYHIASKLWKRLPLYITNTLGPRLVRYLPEL